MIRTTIHVRREHYCREQFGFSIIHHLPDGRIAVANPLTMTAQEPECVLPDESTFQLDHEQASRLMDELWNAGVRPSDVGSAGQLAATQAHLSDMRALVFKTPPKP